MAEVEVLHTEEGLRVTLRKMGEQWRASVFTKAGTFYGVKESRSDALRQALELTRDHFDDVIETIRLTWMNELRRSIAWEEIQPVFEAIAIAGTLERARRMGMESSD